MRTPPRLALWFVLGSVSCMGPAAAAAEPGCNRWDLEVTCLTDPPRVAAGDRFKATVTARNSGDVALANVTLQLRGDLGSRPAEAEAPLQAIVERLEPGETRELTVVFTCDAVGVTRIIGGARDALGWAAANGACTVEVTGLPALQSDMADRDLADPEKLIFHVGDVFAYVLDVQNGGTTATPDLKVLFTLPPELVFVSGEGEPGITVTGAGQAAESSGFALAAKQGARVTIQVKVLAVSPTNFVQTRASIQTTGGLEVAMESESTTLTP